MNTGMNKKNITAGLPDTPDKMKKIVKEMAMEASQEFARIIKNKKEKKKKEVQ